MSETGKRVEHNCGLYSVGTGERKGVKCEEGYASVSKGVGIRSDAGE